MKRAILAILLLTAPAFGADHLEPEASAFVPSDKLWFHEYNDMVLTQLKDLYDSHIVARMIVIPSFSPEYGVGLTNKGHDWRIVAVKSAVHLWAYAMMGKDEIREANLPSDWHAIAVNRCEQPIDPALAARIANLWERMLAETRYAGTMEQWTAGGLVHGSIETVGVDGETYHFSIGDWMAQTWSPSESSPPGMLVGIGAAMIAYCQANDANALAAIEQKTAALEQRLNEGK